MIQLYSSFDRVWHEGAKRQRAREKKPENNKNINVDSKINI